MDSCGYASLGDKIILVKYGTKVIDYETGEEAPVVRKEQNPNSITNRQKPYTVAKHQDALTYMDNLVLDLQLIKIGKKPNNPIDDNRLDEWTKIRQSLAQDQETLLKY